VISVAEPREEIAQRRLRGREGQFRPRDVGGRDPLQPIVLVAEGERAAQHLRRVDHDDHRRRRVGVDADQGAQITDVAPGTPAAKAGLAVGDVVTAIDGQDVGSAADLVAAIRNHKSGDKVQLQVLRDGAGRMIEVTLAVRPTNP